ncbi:MAG: polysaccharide deacetylase [Acidobacteriales bacterium]|nr:polysaccharide deacetylase [Terriglobales bacterium]
MSKPIFYDPDRRRWKRLRTLLDFVGIVITIVIVVFLISTLRSETLPNLLLPDQRKPYHALKEKEKASRRNVAKKPPKSTGGNAEAGTIGDGPRAAFYVQWDAGSFSSLKQYYPQIDILFPEWLHVLTPDGRVQAVTSENKLFDISQSGRILAPDDKVMPFLKSENAATQVIPLVNNFQPVTKQWLDNIGEFLNNADGRRNFVQQMDALMASDKYKGLSIDFEEIPLKSQPGYRALIKQLYDDFHPRGLKLYVNVPVDDKDFDYKFLAANSDGLVLMNYDEHQSGGGPGAIASQDWFETNLRNALKDIPREKVMCAIGNYGYDWSTTPGRTKRSERKVVNAITVSAQEAWLSAKESEVDVELDPDTLNPHFAFIEDDKVQHDIWFLDAVSAVNEMRTANQLGIDSFALWRLGSEDRSLWAIWDAPSLPDIAQKLRRVPPGQDVDFEGHGEVMRIEQKPLAGERVVGTIDSDTGLITSETMKLLPTPYRIAQYGSKPKTVSFTFDDGPDPTFTPQILDVLKRENVKATFFLIGIQADKYSGLTRRIYKEGHEIGNHTFTHPDVSSIGRRYMEIELNLTERYFASEIGVKPIYFRPPYSVDEEPDTADQVRPLEVVENRGYITVGNKIDPNDWHDNPAPAPEEIVASVLASLDKGNIILLHDGGGNRAQTVRALPLLISELRKRGYAIVPVSELLGKSREEVMPHIASGEQFTASIDRFAFFLFWLVNQGIVGIFFVGDFLMTGRLLFVGVAAIADRIRGNHPELLPGAESYRPTVAIIVPAFNEEKVIERTLRSVLASNYPNIKVIMVDDGSTDDTYNIARKLFTAEIADGRLLVLTQKNAGKAAAANFGLQHVNEEVFVAIDADTFIAPNAVAYLVAHFANPKIGAVAGNAKVGNRINVWTRWQALEYITSQNFERRALNLVGAVSVVPGAIGAWRTSAVKAAGGYPFDTVAEDADLTMSLLQSGYEVHYEDRALAYTEAPMNARGLMRQRFRWSFGILQAVWKHRSAFWRGGTLGWIALPNILIFQIVLPLVSPFIDLMFLFGTLNYLIDRHFHPDTASSASFQKLVLFFALFLIIDFAASTIAFALERKQARSPLDKWLLSQVWLQRFAYRQLFSLVLFKTLKRAFDGRSFAWDKLERTASLTHAGTKSS